MWTSSQVVQLLERSGSPLPTLPATGRGTRRPSTPTVRQMVEWFIHAAVMPKKGSSAFFWFSGMIWRRRIIDALVFCNVTSFHWWLQFMCNWCIWWSLPPALPVVSISWFLPLISWFLPKFHMFLLLESDHVEYIAWRLHLEVPDTAFWLEVAGWWNLRPVN